MPTVDRRDEGPYYILNLFRHVIPTVDRRDEGPYFCEADNQLGQTGKGELNLIVLHEPKV